MPLNTSGLRRGGPGRPKGSRNKVPKTLKASVKDVLEEVAVNNRADIYAAIVKGVKSKPPSSLRYLEIIAHYIDGRPTETIRIKGAAILPPLQVLLHPDGVEDKKK